MTDGRCDFIDEIWKPGFAVRPHFHVVHSELFYLLAGQVEWTVSGETHTLAAGDAVFIPPDAVRQVHVVGTTDVRTLWIVFCRRRTSGRFARAEPPVCADPDARRRHGQTRPGANESL